MPKEKNLYLIYVENCKLCTNHEVDSHHYITRIAEPNLQYVVDIALPPVMRIESSLKTWMSLFSLQGVFCDIAGIGWRSLIPTGRHNGVSITNQGGVALVVYTPKKWPHLA